MIDYSETDRLVKLLNDKGLPDSAFERAMQNAEGHLWRIDDKLRVAQRLLFLARWFIVEANRNHDPKNLDFVNSDWDRKSLMHQIHDEIEKMKENIQ